MGFFLLFDIALKSLHHLIADGGEIILLTGNTGKLLPGINQTHFHIGHFLDLVDQIAHLFGKT